MTSTEWEPPASNIMELVCRMVVPIRIIVPAVERVVGKPCLEH